MKCFGISSLFDYNVDITILKESYTEEELNTFMIENKMKEIYEEQEELLIEIVENQNKYFYFKQQLERTKEVLRSLPRNSIREKDYLLEMNPNESYTEDKMKEISMHFTTKEKEKMKLYKLDNYCVMIAAKYFESIDDFMNLELGCKRYRGTIDKFHYNPIPITPSIIPIFTHLRTLNLYSPNDEMIQSESIIAYEIWYTMTIDYYFKLVMIMI